MLLRRRQRDACMHWYRSLVGLIHRWPLITFYDARVFWCRLSAWCVCQGAVQTCCAGCYWLRSVGSRRGCSSPWHAVWLSIFDCNSLIVSLFAIFIFVVNVNLKLWQAASHLAGRAVAVAWHTNWPCHGILERCSLVLKLQAFHTNLCILSAVCCCAFVCSVFYLAVCCCAFVCRRCTTGLRRLSASTPMWPWPLCHWSQK